MDIPECCICYDGLNDSIRRPRSLPCGHTICTRCIDKSIENGDKTCPSCRQPHRVAAAYQLPINYALEEIVKNQSVESWETNRIDTEKKTILNETRDFIYTFETSLLELQNKLRSKENLIDNHQGQIEKKMAEIESLKKDIEKEDKVKQGIAGSITELDEKIRFLENSVQSIRICNTSSDVLNIYGDVKRKLQISTPFQDDTTENLNMNDSQLSEEDLKLRIVHLIKTEGRLGFRTVGGIATNHLMYICEIYPDTPAHRHGGLKPGDRLLSVNGVSMVGPSQTHAAELLKSATGEITLEVRYTPGALEETRKKYQTLGLKVTF